MNLSTPVAAIPFIGPIYAKRLEKLGIFTAQDFLHHYPSRYQDFSIISPIAQAQGGETVTIQGEITSFSNKYTRRRMTIQKATLKDNTGTMEITWFNQPFLEKALAVGTKVNLAGEIDYFRGKPVMTSPEHEVINSWARQGRAATDLQNTKYHIPNTIHTGRLVPIYPETYGVSSKWLRSRIVYLLKNIRPLEEEFLPETIQGEFRLATIEEAIRTIHFPNSQQESKTARYRLGFDEILFSQLASLIRQQQWRSEVTAYQLKVKNYELRVKEFMKHVPFDLTTAQKRVIDEIFSDLKKTKPMNRLVQGDVGSGKTVVAGIAMYAMHKEGYNSVLMAPTEILAQQHYKTLKNLFEPLGIPVALVTSSTKERKGDEPITIGTHALLFKQKFKKLGLVVIDEQHRFGVEQRTKLRELGVHPHLLAMTATPIPRSIALVLYSELDLSVIDEMPVGRIPIKTWLVPNEKRRGAYEWMKKQLTANGQQQTAKQKSKEAVVSEGERAVSRKQSAKNQAFIICPLIEESESETMATVKAATKEFETLKKEFNSFKVGLVHGKLKGKDKKDMLEQFGAKKLDILVATPVVEVGIDIPNATVMLIEAAERFGLAQLHQLRGRVGRGEKQSYCLLFTESEKPGTRARLKSLETMTTGNELAELDLKLRGPGDMFGRAQSGYVSFKIADFSNRSLIAAAQKAAHQILDENVLPSSEKLQKRLESYTIQRISPN